MFDYTTCKTPMTKIIIHSVIVWMQCKQMIPLFAGDTKEPPQRPLGLLGPHFENHSAKV